MIVVFACFLRKLTAKVKRHYLGVAKRALEINGFAVAIIQAQAANQWVRMLV